MAEQGGENKGVRTYRVATPKKHPGFEVKKRKYIQDSASFTQEAFDYYERVAADGGVSEAKLCLEEKIYQLKY